MLPLHHAPVLDRLAESRLLIPPIRISAAHSGSLRKPETSVTLAPAFTPRLYVRSQDTDMASDRGVITDFTNDIASFARTSPSFVEFAFSVLQSSLPSGSSHAKQRGEESNPTAQRHRFWRPIAVPAAPSLSVQVDRMGVEPTTPSLPAKVAPTVHVGPSNHSSHLR